MCAPWRHQAPTVVLNYSFQSIFRSSVFKGHSPYSGMSLTLCFGIPIALSYFYTSDDWFSLRHKPVTFADPLCDSTDLGETAEVQSEQPKANTWPQKMGLAQGHISPVLAPLAGATRDHL